MKTTLIRKTAIKEAMRKNMKSTALTTIFCAAALLLIINACDRRPLENEFAEMALIPVRIDWSKSGIDVTSPDGNGLVHRVSVRFFPTDGSPAFDRYLETNVLEEIIEVPPGNYNVVVFNESVHDVYWEDAIYFSDVNDYNNFAANIVTDNAANYPLYVPLYGEQFIVEPYKLASWSLGNFEVTREMVIYSRSITNRNSLSRSEVNNALTYVTMRPLTYNVTVVARVENLCSAQQIQTAMRGFSSKVYMASARTEQIPVTHIFNLNGRVWDDPANPVHGTTRKTFLSFGQLPQPFEYWVNLDVLFVTGERFVPSQPLLFNVTEQVNNESDVSVGIDVNINIDIDIAIDIELPYVEGGIHVGEWDDENVILQ